MKVGDWVLYKETEVGRVASFNRHGKPFVCYHAGETAALTPLDTIRKIGPTEAESKSKYKLEEIGGGRFDCLNYFKKSTEDNRKIKKDKHWLKNELKEVLKEELYDSTTNTSSAWYLKDDVDSLVDDLDDTLKELPTLAEILGWEEMAEKKYYAKIKGWELFGEERYINYDVEYDELLASKKNKVEAFETIFTKKEWSSLGVNDSNADFEEGKNEQPKSKIFEFTNIVTAVTRH